VAPWWGLVLTTGGTNNSRRLLLRSLHLGRPFRVSARVLKRCAETSRVAADLATSLGLRLRL
jgi:hypothetical protein